MFARLRRARPDGDIASALYGAIVAQARVPELYTELAVPDTVEGRFEMVVVHQALVIRRLERGDEATRTIGQGVFDVFCREMDDALRALGVKDTSVAKRMRKVAEAYYGRAAGYESAIARGDAATLAATLDRTVYGEAGGVAPRALAAYMIASDQALAATATERVTAGEIAWPPVDAKPPAGANA
ncbi:MAG: ubiquinol-cytochrome C chaperone [Bauldia sp.]|nr:ubiquinol-cytochrome C chaperone [Bauldia sp.]